MEYIQIPFPGFSFADIAKNKAELVCSNFLQYGRIYTYAQRNEKGAFSLTEKIRGGFDELITIEDQLIYSAEILRHIDSIQFESFATAEEEQKFFRSKNTAKHFVYSLLNSIGINTDGNTFSSEEAEDIRSSIQSIIEALDKLQAGQEIIFEEFETIRNQIKIEFENLNPDLLLGKEKFFKIALGTIGKFAGNKVADMLFEQIKPQLITFFIAQAPHLIEGASKLLAR